MRLATFKEANGDRLGAVEGKEIVDLTSTLPSPPQTMVELLEAGQGALDQVRAAIDSGEGRRPLEEVQLTAPVAPRKFFGVGLNYADHVAESGLPTPENLMVFMKAPTCVSAPYATVERPVVSDQLDYEGELGFVIGTRCRHVRADRAHEVIAGYTIVNDFSVRDWQLMTSQWSLGKSFDTHGPIGPWITTADELPDPLELDIRTYVNDDLRQSSNTRELIFSCFEQVQFLSQVCTLEPGDVIATGTPSGVAGALEGKPWLVPGDCVRVEIDGLGTIENNVVQEPEVEGFSVAGTAGTAGS
jgi:2-keto-4-pentenoate hydratase/2-oxohepta-3-ene-1,7-dioic acid hydratase in catechol pathway